MPTSFDSDKASMRNLQQLRLSLDHYDLFLLDQFGVLHDGITAYPGALRALQWLKAVGKTVIIISNSGRRSAVNVERMSRLGFPADAYSQLVTSGEVAWQSLRQEIAAGKFGELPRCCLISRFGETTGIDGLDVERVDDPAQADFILLSGKLNDTDSMDDYKDLLSAAAALGKLCICTNPDKLELVKGGTTFGTGAVAEAYQQAGGEVRLIGKPHAAIYQYILDQQELTGTDSVVAFGDSVEHDIVGGNNAGVQTVLVRTGILADLSESELQQVYDECGSRPDFVVPGFGSLVD